MSERSINFFFHSILCQLCHGLDFKKYDTVTITKLELYCSPLLSESCIIFEAMSFYNSKTNLANIKV